MQQLETTRDGVRHDARQVERVGRAVRGDRAALKLLLLEAHAGLCACIERRIPPELRGVLGCEDVAQEAYARAFRHIGRLDPRGGREGFRRWLWTIALRRLRSAIQRQWALKRGGPAARAAAGGPQDADSSDVDPLTRLCAPGRTPSRAVASREAAAAVGAALGTLPGEQLDAMRMVYLLGWPVGQAAARMGRSERAVHGLCRRGKQTLRRLLGSASRFLSAGA